MKTLNRVTLLGNIGKEPEVRDVNGSKVANFSIATSESYKDKSGEWKEITDWHNIQAWQGLAEIVEKYCHKGSKVYIEGKLKTRSYDKDGQTVYITDVKADNIILLSNETAVAKPTFKEDTNDSNEIPF